MQLGFGCANLASMRAGAGGAASTRLVQLAHDEGVRFFDVADAYGDGVAEQVLSRAFRSRPDDVTIATKAGFRFSQRPMYERIARRVLRPVTQRTTPSAMSRLAETTRGPAYTAQDFSLDYLSQALDGSLRRLAGLTIDCFQVHEPGDVAIDDILEWAQRSIDSGKFRRFGVCLRPGSDARPWLASPVVTVAHVAYGLLDQSADDQQIPLAAERDAEVITHGVLGQGLLTDNLTAADLAERSPDSERLLEFRRLAACAGVSSAQAAIWFVRAHPAISVALVGMSSRDSLQATVRAFNTDPIDTDLVAQSKDLLRPEPPQPSAS
ncbi:MAG: aldo/keto reductase [Ilumatobacter sp.]|uniref:aldo/keto reductase n=1 Tax=Ilumatobacter sp. TaxID=1967498 RepID=UPI003298813D